MCEVESRGEAKSGTDRGAVRNNQGPASGTRTCGVILDTHSGFVATNRCCCCCYDDDSEDSPTGV